MKTNYKQSQAAPHAKPIFTVSRNDSTLYVLPAYLAGAVMIRLQHIADGDKVKKLCCKVKNDRLMAMEQDPCRRSNWPCRGCATCTAWMKPCYVWIARQRLQLYGRNARPRAAGAKSQKYGTALRRYRTP